MECTGSKLDDLPAVALFRDRCVFLDNAINKRYSLAGAHLAYIHSLRDLGLSLHKFFDQDLVFDSPPSPVLNLPPKGKGKGDPQPSDSVPAVSAPAPAPAIHHSRSNSHSHSGSHLTFNSESGVSDDEGGKASVSSENHYHTRPSVSMEDDAVEYGVHVVDKKVVDKDDRPGDRQAAGGGGGGSRNDAEVMKEILVQFERASDSGNDIAKMLEVGKLPYNKKHGGYLVSAKMLHASLPMVASHPSAENADLDMNDDIGLRTGGLSSTLQKLLLWEKKLYEEVKVEEKMRILHERKLRRLKRLDEKGAEQLKVDTTRRLVRDLSTKIRISIQVVDKISVKINKVRDEDLWPQLNEFIQGLARMWKSEI